MDDLGNRDSLIGPITLRNGTINFTPDALNNKYTDIGGPIPNAYDNAGNLVQFNFGTANTYTMIYDYENRLIEINKPSGLVAQFTYDALSRRIQTYDGAAVTKHYYYSDKWQVLAEYNGSIGIMQKINIFGNYIDELLYRRGGAASSVRYFIHDHLYSPVASYDAASGVKERYEYDAYGNCRILDNAFVLKTPQVPADTAIHPNPYLFTGRRVDILDGGSLKLQYYRNRYYDTYTGRFLTKDPLGVTPHAPAPNTFAPLIQYTDGMNLYQYVNDNPVGSVDPFGAMSEEGFFMNFLTHWAWGNGHAFTNGADVLQRQIDLKRRIDSYLITLANEVCDLASSNPGGIINGDINRNIGDVQVGMDFYMNITLNVPHRYKIKGTYHAKNKNCGEKCTVNLNLAHIWVDMGDLNLNNWPDRLMWALTLIARWESRGAAFQDFPIRITWHASNTMVRSEGKPQYKSTGWPFD